MQIIVLGAGMVGSAMALDLSTQFKVTVADKNEGQLLSLQNRCKVLATKKLDVTLEAELKEAISGFDMVLCAVPGFLGYQTLTWILEASKNVVDISFFPEDALQLNELAIENDVTAIVDCGVAPGMSNFALGYHNETMKINRFDCVVGGLPKVKKWPFSYKAPFSPVDVIEEYTRPARYVENSCVVTKPALSDVAHLDFEHIGTLESFNSDGLRSIIKTMSHIPNMKEKTLRYPGHVEYISVLKESGFFDEDKSIIQDGLEMSPLDFTSKILFKEWKLKKDEKEFTVMRIEIEGESEIGIEEEIIYDLYDEFDVATSTSSMARTTGYTATGAVNLIEKGIFSKKGVFPPELVGSVENCFLFILKYLSERGVQYRKQTILK